MPKRILVTGASMGIGAAVAAHLARIGHDLVLMDIDGDGLEIAARQLPGRMAVSVGSVADAGQCESAVALAVERFGGLDGVSHNAGIQRYGDVVSTSMDIWNEVLAVNLTGAFLVAKAAMPELRRNRAPRCSPLRCKAWRHKRGRWLMWRPSMGLWAL